MSDANHIAALREARGWKRPHLATRMGTTPQQLERLEKGQRRLTLDWINRAAAALDVEPAEIIGGDAPTIEPRVKTEGVPFKFEGSSLDRMREDLPVFGTALGAAKMVEGEAVEQTTLNTGDVIRYLKRPVLLNGRSDVYGLYVVGNSMWPAHPEGSTIVAETKRQPKVGDDVVVYLRDIDADADGDERARAVLIKRLVRRTTTYIELQQFEPRITFRLDMADVFRVDRVMTLDDLIS